MYLAAWSAPGTAVMEASVFAVVGFVQKDWVDTQAGDKLTCLCPH
jgi:hypothetical protein